MKKDNKDLFDGPKKNRTDEKKPSEKEDKKRNFDNDDLSFKVKFIPNSYENKTDSFKPNNRNFNSDKKSPSNKTYSKPNESFDNKRTPRFDEKKSYDKPYSKSKPSGSFDDKRTPRFDEKKPYDKPYSKPKPSGSFDDKRTPRFDEKKSFNKPFTRSNDRNDRNDRKPYNSNGENNRSSFSQPRDNDNFKPRESFKLDSEDENKPFKKPFKLGYDPQVPLKKQSYQSRIFKESKQQDKKQEKVVDSDNRLRLNKYIAQSGICSRREADEFIKKGSVTVNNVVIKEMGHKVNPGDNIKFEGKTILSEPFVYILMNKPKDFITTTEDDKGRKTVLDLLVGKVNERVFPVGRLDRNTTGVLLITNDGELTQILTHPSYQIKKVYHATLDKKVSQSDLDKLVEGIELEDGVVHADAVAYVESEDKRHVGLEIHSGKNHIVKRMFEHLGYDVERLDRVSFGTFTKKDLPRGKWRFLTNYELASIMKMKDKASKQ
jgi:23S rRNA pseudouridine2605 synthase